MEGDAVGERCGGEVGTRKRRGRHELESRKHVC